MKQNNIHAKERIMDTVVNLLLERKDIHKITTRQIAELANVNSALINYYYQSKDNLVLKAVEICMENMVIKLSDKDFQNETHVNRLKNMIKEISTFAFNNYYLSEIAISAELKHGGINTIQIILPLLKAIFKESKAEIELKVMAMQLVTSMQMMLLNAKEYTEYLSMDIFNDRLRNELLDQMVDNILKPES